MTINWALKGTPNYPDLNTSIKPVRECHTNGGMRSMCVPVCFSPYIPIQDGHPGATVMFGLSGVHLLPNSQTLAPCL